MSGTNAVVLLAAALAGAAAALLPRPPARARLSATARAPAGGARRPPATGSSRRAQPPAMLLAAGSCGAGVAALTGGWAGAVLGPVAAVVAFAVLRRLEPAHVRRRRERLAADLPTAIDLLGACLSAGSPPTPTLRVVSSAIEGQVAEELDVVASRLELGADPVLVWRELGRSGAPLAGLGRTMARSTETGAPMADGLSRLAGDLRARRRAAAEQQARSVGVRAAAPLGLCFLPAFVLVGIVPAIVSAFAGLSWS